MIYIVTGWLRHGTSMMMGCLEAGGMNVVSSTVREQSAAARWHDKSYIGNDRYYELTQQELAAINFPLDYVNRVVKCLRYDVLGIAAHDPGYRIIYMRRDGEETRQSMQALMGCQLHEAVAGEIERHTQRIVDILRQRRDCFVDEVRYRGVVDEPALCFEALAQAGWPIDAEKAAIHVDPDKCRFRREELVEGV